MRLLIINLLLLFSTQVWSQTDLEIGLVSIDFDDKTILEFYSDTSATEPKKVVKFFDDRSINSWNIKDLDKQKEWLKTREFLLFLFYLLLLFKPIPYKSKIFTFVV